MYDRKFRWAIFRLSIFLSFFLAFILWLVMHKPQHFGFGTQILCLFIQPAISIEWNWKKKKNSSIGFFFASFFTWITHFSEKKFVMCMNFVLIGLNEFELLKIYISEFKYICSKSRNEMRIKNKSTISFWLVKASIFFFFLLLVFVSCSAFVSSSSIRCFFLPTLDCDKTKVYFSYI